MGQRSRLQTLTIEEYHAEREQRSGPRPRVSRDGDDMGNPVERIERGAEMAGVTEARG